MGCWSFLRTLSKVANIAVSVYGGIVMSSGTAAGSDAPPNVIIVLTDD